MRPLVVLVLLGVLSAQGPAHALVPGGPTRFAVAATLAPSATPPSAAQWPVSFQLNTGQTDPAVRFLADIPGGTAFFTQAGLVLALDGAGAPGRPAPARPGLAPESNTSAQVPATAARVLRVAWLGANPAPLLTGDALLPGRANYLRGNDPARWHTNVPTYGAIRYQDLYPGVELRYASAAGQLKGTYTLAPGADPRRLRWRYTDCGMGSADCGTDEPQISVDAEGNLQIDLPPNGDDKTQSRTSRSALHIREAAPVAWQERAGRRVAVGVRYALGGDGSVGFAVGSYDPAQPLIIDPTLSYSTYLGGDGDEELTAIAVDASGNIYSAGYSTSANFPAKAPVLVSHDERDVIVVKLDPTGGTLLYETYLSGELADWAFGIAVNRAGNAYLTGLTESPDFPLQNPIQELYGGVRDAFVLELTADGSGLVYSTYLGGSGLDSATGIVLDSANNAYVTGYTTSTDFPVAQAFQPVYGGGAADVFIAKLNAAGSALVYATYLGGSDDDSGGLEKSTGIAVDAAGNIYLAGATLSRDFPLHAPLQATPRGQDDVFVTELNAAGTDLIYSTYLGGSGEDAGASIRVDEQGNTYLTGLTDSADFPVHNPYQAAYGGGTFDAFVAKVSPGGTALVYATYYGAEYDERGRSLAVDAAGNAFIAGYVDSYAFPLVNPVQAGYGGGIYDAFAARLNAAGSQPLFSTYMGGSLDDYYEAVALDSAGTAHLSGATASSDWPLAGQPVQEALAAGFDGVISSISLQGPPAPDCTAQFSDVPAADPFYPPIRYLACRQIISGYGDGTFRPGSPITRGGVAKIVASSAGMTAYVPANQQTFADVPRDQPFWIFIERLARPGLISGYACGGPDEPCDAQRRPYFRPGAAITRGQLAKIVALAAGQTQPPVAQTFEDVPPQQPFFAWIEPLAAQGIISGYQCGAPPAGPCQPPDARPYFLPGNPVTRAQTAKIVANSFYPGYQIP